NKEISKQIKNLSTIFKFKKINKEDRIIRGVIGTTGNLDRHGDTVNPDGWVLENFLKNPVVFVNHESWTLPVGKVIGIEKVENGILFDVQFAQGTKQADEVWLLVEQKIMQAWSVGFIVLEWGKPGDEYTIMKQELLELSIVGLPANPDALSSKQAKSLKDLKSYIEKHGEEKHKNNHSADKENEKNNKSGNIERKVDGHLDILNEIVKRLENIEQSIKVIKEEQEKNVENIVKFTKQMQSDEAMAKDHIFLALNAVQQELRGENKNTGKALRQLNQVLNILQE
ncbi:MAG: hypothetical protein D6822_08405, partial [Cyanobacteria bacterium J149]